MCVLHIIESLEGYRLVKVCYWLDNEVRQDITIISMPDIVCPTEE